jgi:hypothetical protein
MSAGDYRTLRVREPFLFPKAVLNFEFRKVAALLVVSVCVQERMY